VSSVAQHELQATPPSARKTTAATSAPQPPGKLLEPITLERLGQFAHRRKSLRKRNGLAAVGILAIATLLVAVLIDGLIPRTTAQWVASSVFYLPVLLALGGWVWRPWRRPINWSREAVLFEERDPTLRGNLLSALELSWDETDARTSLAFRRELQQQVANEIASSEIESLLPIESLVRRMKWVAGAALMFVIFLLVPGVHGPLRVSRVLAPFLDWGRASHVRITVLEPSSHSTSVALRDSIAVVAQLDRPSEDSVELEIRQEDGLVRRLELSPPAGRTRQGTLRSTSDTAKTKLFATTLTAADARTRFRVTSGSALTPWYTLNASERPVALSMRARVTLPDYARALTLPEIEAQDADLRVLRGAKVDWTAEFNQPIRKASWQIQNTLSEQSEQPLTFTLLSDETSGTASLQASATLNLRLDLQSGTSGLRNGLPRNQRLEVRTDKPPKIRWQSPTPNVLSKAAAEVVDFSLSIEDELPLAELTQVVRVLSSSDLTTRTPAPLRKEQVSQLEHQTLPALAIPALKALANGELWREESRGSVDLLSLNLQAGDRIEILVRATDLRGQTQMTTPLLINVSSIGLNLAQGESEKARGRIAQRMENLAASLPTTNEVRELTATERQGLADDLAKSFDGAFPILSADIKRAVSDSNNIGTTHEMLQLSVGLQQFRNALSDSNTLAVKLDELQKQLDQIRTLSSAATAFSADDTARRHSTNLLGLANGFASLAQDAELSTEANARRQQILFRQTSQIAQDMLDSVETLPEQSRQAYLNAVARLETLARQAETRLSAAILTTDQDSEASQVNPSRAQIQARRDVKRFAGATASALRSLGGVANLHAWIPEQATRKLQQLSQAARPASEQMVVRLNSEEGFELEPMNQSARDLTMLRNLFRTSKRIAGQFSSDLGLASRAIEATVKESLNIEKTQAASRSNTQERLEAITRALRVLEVTEHNSQAASHLRDLLETERWQQSSPQAATESPRVWDSFKILASRNADTADSSSLPPDVKELLAKLSWNSLAKEIQDKIHPRRWNASSYESAAQPLEDLLREVEAVQVPLEVQADAARQTLQRIGPTLAELAENAGEETRELSRQTLASDETKASDKTEPSVAMNQQTRTAEQAINRLRDALVDLADSRDLLRSDQLEMARLADEGIEIADQASDSVAKSTELFAPTAKGKQSALPDKVDIAQAAAAQARAAQALDDLASLMNLQNSPATSKDRADRAAEIATSQRGEPTPAGSPASTQPKDDRFSKARQLAQIAESDPEELLRSLEAALPKNKAMQKELSAIARALTEQALRDLTSAASQESSIRNRIENSDPASRQRKEELLDILKVLQRETLHVANLFLREAGTAAQLAKLTEAKSTFARTEETIQKHLASLTTDHTSEQSLSELRRKLQQLKRTLTPIVEELNQQGEELLAVSERPFHSNGSELNNRRRSMHSRGNRIRTQDAKNLQQLAQQLQQQLRPVRDQLRLAQEQLQRAAEHSLEMREEAEQNADPKSHNQLLRAQQNLALARNRVAATEGRLQRSEQRLQATQARARAVKQAKQKLLDSQNPSAELAAQIAGWSVVRLQEILAQVASAELDATETAATSEALSRAADAQTQVQRQVESAAKSLARASRHEGRLANERSQQELATAAASAESAALNELARITQTIGEALADSNSDVTSGQTTAQNTARVMTAAGQGREAIEKTQTLLKSILGRSDSTPSTETAGTRPSSSPSSRRPLTPRQMAELLNELDDRLSETQLGVKEDDASPAPADAGKPSPSTLRKAAEQLAKSLSRSRSNPTRQANSDLGLATDSELANVEPQGPNQVQLLDVTRLGADWGKLREQTTDDALQSDRRTFAPHLQRQVDAYFKNIGQEVGKQ
jgi:hypothetical protein